MFVVISQGDMPPLVPSLGSSNKLRVDTFQQPPSSTDQIMYGIDRLSSPKNTSTRLDFVDTSVDANLSDLFKACDTTDSGFVHKEELSNKLQNDIGFQV